jgi:hypothetical protein
MMGLLARPAMETLTRRGEGAKARAAVRRDAGRSGAAAGRGAASLDTVPVIAARRGCWWEVRGRADGTGGLVAHGGCCEVLLLVSMHK